MAISPFCDVVRTFRNPKVVDYDIVYLQSPENKLL